MKKRVELNLAFFLVCILFSVGFCLAIPASGTVPNISTTECSGYGFVQVETGTPKQCPYGIPSAGGKCNSQVSEVAGTDGRIYCDSSSTTYYLCKNTNFEACNKIDDDCDGLIDEDCPLVVPCPTYSESPPYGPANDGLNDLECLTYNFDKVVVDAWGACGSEGPAGREGTCIAGARVYCDDGMGKYTTCRNTQEFIGNNVDDDCDGSIDEADAVCPTLGAGGGCNPVPEICSNGIDDDCDRLTDEVDCRVCNPIPEICSNGIDDDCDRLTDEVDCRVCNPIPEICSNGIDDDCDREIDEVDCRVCNPIPEICSNGLDDDCDREIDEVDCRVCNPIPEICSNGLDDDCDSLTDEVACIIPDTIFFYSAAITDLNGHPLRNARVNQNLLAQSHSANISKQNVNATLYKVNGQITWWRFWNLFSDSAVKQLSAIEGGGELYFSLFNIPEEGDFYLNLKDKISNKSINTSVITINSNGCGGACPSSNNVSVMIISPVDEINVSVNTPILFKQVSRDADDLLNVTWKFGDGSFASVQGYSGAVWSEKADISHTYASVGRYKVELISSEMNKANPEKANKTIWVNVFEEGINVIPVIVSPADGTIEGRLFVFFNANESYVKDCSLVMGAWLCTNVHFPKQKIIIGDYDLRVNWTVYTNNVVDFSKQGSWKRDYNNIVEFISYVSTPGKHIVKLKIDYI
jgi:hypothetical protein